MATSDNKSNKKINGHSLGGKQAVNKNSSWIDNGNVENVAVDGHSKGGNQDVHKNISWVVNTNDGNDTVDGHSKGVNVAGKAAERSKTASSSWKDNSTKHVVTSDTSGALPISGAIPKTDLNKIIGKWKKEQIIKDLEAATKAVKSSLSAGDIMIDTSAVKKVAEDLKKINKGINSDAAQMDKAMNTLDKAWNGAASEKAVSVYKDLYKAFCTEEGNGSYSRYKTMDIYADFLLNAVGEMYETTEKTNIGLSDTFK